MKATGIAAMLLAVVLTVSSTAAAQARSDAAEDEREQALVDALRREDPSAAERYVALRDARQQAVVDLRRAEAQFNAVGSELRSAFLRPLQQARRTYVERSLALLEFFEARDRQALARYQEEIGRIKQRLEEHGRMRGELEKLLQ